MKTKLYLIKSKDTWVELDCDIDFDRKCLICNDGKEYPLIDLKKVIRKIETTRGFLRKRKETIVETFYIQIMKSSTKAVVIDEKGEYSELEDTTVLENAVAQGLQRAMERMPIWWQWVLLFIMGAVAGTGLGAFLTHLWFKCPTVQIIKP